MSRLDDVDPGSFWWRDEDGHRLPPTANGYIFEHGAWLAARDQAFAASGLPEIERTLFESGWYAAYELKGPWPPYSAASRALNAAWMVGWHAWPGRRWEDPLAGFHEDYARERERIEQDDVTRKLKDKEAKRRKAV